MNGAPLVPTQQNYSTQMQEYETTVMDILTKYSIAGTRDEIAKAYPYMTLEEKEIIDTYRVLLGY